MSSAPSLVECYCGNGKRTRVWTSWTDRNPGRRFLACSKNRNGGCNFFRWEDPPMCARSKVVIPALLRKMGRSEEKLKNLERRSKILKYLLVGSWILFIEKWMA